MVLSLGLENSRRATAAQSAVTNATNELLKKNGWVDWTSARRFLPAMMYMVSSL